MRRLFAPPLFFNPPFLPSLTIPQLLPGLDAIFQLEPPLADYEKSIRARLVEFRKKNVTSLGTRASAVKRYVLELYATRQAHRAPASSPKTPQSSRSRQGSRTATPKSITSTPGSRAKEVRGERERSGVVGVFFSSFTPAPSHNLYPPPPPPPPQRPLKPWDIVWVKLFSFPWFPAVVVDPEVTAEDAPEGFCPNDAVLAAAPAIKGADTLKLVRFFDARGSWCERGGGWQQYGRRRTEACAHVPLSHLFPAHNRQWASAANICRMRVDPKLDEELRTAPSKTRKKVEVSRAVEMLGSFCCALPLPPSCCNLTSLFSLPFALGCIRGGHQIPRLDALPPQAKNILGSLHPCSPF